MPNVPCQVSQGASGMCLGQYATEAARAAALAIFGAVGVVTVVRESQLDGEWTQVGGRHPLAPPLPAAPPY